MSRACLVHLLTGHDPPNRILRAWQRDEFVLIASDHIAHEVARVLSRESIQRRYRPDPTIVSEILAELRAVAIAPLPLDALPVHCRDPKDDPVLACALAGDADFIVTGDADLLILDGHPALGSLRIVTPRTFLSLLGEPP